MVDYSGVYNMHRSDDERCTVTISKVTDGNYRVHWNYHRKQFSPLPNNYSEVRDAYNTYDPIKRGVWVKQIPTVLQLPVGV